MRLDKYLCITTQLTRSQAKTLIRQGKVTVNHLTIKQPQTQVQPDASVTLEGESLHLPGPVYLMMYKPEGYVSALTDALHPCLIDLCHSHPQWQDLHIAGRLDKDTTGLILLTNDGQWSHRLMSPNFRCGKTYLTTTESPLSPEDISLIASGLWLKNETKPTSPAIVKHMGQTQYQITIYEGMYHQVKRMLAAVGHHVLSLHRTAIGSLTLDPILKPGDYRALTDEECLLLTSEPNNSPKNPATQNPRK